MPSRSPEAAAAPTAGERLRALTFSALAQAIEEGRPADRVLERTLRANRDLSSAERAALARRLLGIACLRARLGHLLATLAPGTSGPAWLLAAYLVDQEGQTPAQAAVEAGLPEEQLSRLGGVVPWPSDPVERLCAQRSLPRWLAQLWTDQLGPDQADRLACATNRPGPITARANLLKGTREELIAALASERIEALPASFAPQAVHLQGRPNVFGSRAWREGRFEVQDEGSQLIVGFCAPRPGERCIDFCAGAGGKTLALAALMGDSGEILALDVDRQRIADLQPRLARAGVTCVRSQVIEPAGALPPGAGDADLVLVDAPCSSLGTLRRGPDARWRTTPEKVESFPALQLEILGRAAALVGRAGRLVYATCTLNAAENERVAGRFEDEHPEFRRTPVAELLGAATADRLGAVDRLWLAPHLHRTDGFFAVHWRRDGR